MLNKYNFSDLVEMPVLPIDCNKEAEDAARLLGDPELMVALDLMRERKITNGYGKVTHIGEKGLPDMVFHFKHGICKFYQPLVAVGTKTFVDGEGKCY